MRPCREKYLRANIRVIMIQVAGPSGLTLRPPWYEPRAHLDFLAVCYPEHGFSHALPNLGCVVPVVVDLCRLSGAFSTDLYFD